MKLNITKLLSRKKLWDLFGWTYPGKRGPDKHHSLNCGCGQCKGRTLHRRAENKSNRLKMRLEDKQLEDDIIFNEYFNRHIHRDEGGSEEFL